MSPRRAQAAPPQPRGVRTHLAMLGVVVTAVSTGAYVGYRGRHRPGSRRAGTPHSGCGSARWARRCSSGSWCTRWRKRAGQEWRWLLGGCGAWLRFHVWLSAVGLVLDAAPRGVPPRRETRHVDGPAARDDARLGARRVGASTCGPGGGGERARETWRRLRHASVSGNLEERMQGAAGGRAFDGRRGGEPRAGSAERRTSRGRSHPEEREVFEHVRMLAQERRAEELASERRAGGAASPVARLALGSRPDRDRVPAGDPVARPTTLSSSDGPTAVAGPARTTRSR